MPHRLGHLPGERVTDFTLSRVQAELYPVELRQHVVGKIELAVATDIHLGPAQHAERRELFVRSGDLLSLAPQVVGVEPRDDANVLRVIADREVLVAEVSR